jgi:hypothetical protein
MGQQVGLFALDGDHEDLQQQFESLGLAALPPSTSEDRLPEHVPPRAYRANHPAWHFYYLVPLPAVGPNIRYVRMAVSPPTWRMAADRSPVIEFQPSTISAQRVQGGRIYINCKRDVVGCDLAARAYDSLARRVRRWPRTQGGGRFYVGPQTASRARAGEFRLMIGREEQLLTKNGE